MSIGSMPQFDSERRRRDERREPEGFGAEALREAAPARIAPAPEPIVDERLVSILDPTSAIAEQYRALRTNLLAMRAKGRAMKPLANTSARRGDGKTITSANVAGRYFSASGRWGIAEGSGAEDPNAVGASERPQAGRSDPELYVPLLPSGPDGVGRSAPCAPGA